jgi:hypothetical protein
MASEHHVHRSSGATVCPTKNPSSWKPHNNASEATREIEECNRQASRSQPGRLRPLDSNRNVPTPKYLKQ